MTNRRTRYGKTSLEVALSESRMHDDIGMTAIQDRFIDTFLSSVIKKITSAIEIAEARRHGLDCSTKIMDAFRQNPHWANYSASTLRRYTGASMPDIQRVMESEEFTAWLATVPE